MIARLSPRERVLVLAALPLALVVAGWWLAWVPLSEARAAREAAIAGHRLVAEAAGAGAGAAPVVAAADPMPLAARVTAAAEAAGLSLTRLEPEGDRLRVLVAEAPFAQVLLWLADLEAAHGVLAAAVEMDRRPAPGAVTARVLLEPAT